MTPEELLTATRKHLWAAWALSSEEIGSQAAATLLDLGMLVEPGGAAELERLQSRVAELEEQLAALRAQQGVLRGAAVHHPYRISHDMPETGGAR